MRHAALLCSAYNETLLVVIGAGADFVRKSADPAVRSGPLHAAASTHGRKAPGWAQSLRSSAHFAQLCLG
jgi:hypothetical protein